MQERTKQIIIDDYERVQAYERVFSVPMPKVTPDGDVDGLPAPYPRVVHGVERGGHRIWELSQQAKRTRIPVQNPILGRNTAEETMRESVEMYKTAEELGITLFHFVHSEATRHIDPLDGAELIEQSRGKGGITPQGERDYVAMGGGAKHPMRINATGDTPHLSVINAMIAGFDGTDIGPVIHVQFGGRGIHDYRTKVKNGFRTMEICAENKVSAQIESHKHLNNIGGTDGMALAMCLLAEGLAVLAKLPSNLSSLQMNVTGLNLLADIATMRAFRETMWSGSLIAVPETFQNPPPDLIVEAAHFARMAISAKLGGADFYRPKAAESVGIPTGSSMAKAIWATQNVFESLVPVTINDPYIEVRKTEILSEAMAVLGTTLGKREVAPGEINPAFWQQYSSDELVDMIVHAGKKGILDAPQAGGWDLKRGVKTHRGKDGVKRYVNGYGPTDVPESKVSFTTEDVKVDKLRPVSKKTKVVLATVGADAHVMGVNTVRDAISQAGFEIIFLRGMNLPETVAEIAVEAKADVVGVSNLLGMGMVLFPRLSARLSQLGQRENIRVIAGGRVAEKEEEHAAMEERIKTQGTAFLGVDAFFGPGTPTDKVVEWLQKNVEERK